MSNLSKRTRFINICIGFTKSMPHWPSFLQSAGYDLQSVRPLLVNSSDREVIPDLLFGSNFAQNVLVADCSGEAIPDDLFRDLSDISPADLRTSIENLDVSQLSNETLFIGDTETEASINSNGTDSPAIVIEGDRYRRINDFDDDNLNQNISEGRLPGMRPPNVYHPFSAEDSRARIAVFLAQELAHLAAKGRNREVDIEVEDLLESAFDSWEQISSDEQEELKRKAEDILDLFEQKDVDGHMRKLDQRKYYVNSSKALERKFQEVVDDLSSDDSSLEDFT